MPKYIVSMVPVELIGKLEVQQRLADGRWTPIARVQELDTDAGYAVVLDVDENGVLVPAAGGQIQTRRVQGDFRVIHQESGEVNPPVTAPVPAAQPASSEPSGSPAPVVAMVDSLHQTAQQLPDGTWSSSFDELAEVVGTGATEAEARAHARAQALEIGSLVAGHPKPAA